ncbi:MAG: GNAT family N-acetyltransferase [Pseudomonadales bacterium]
MAAPDSGTGGDIATTIRRGTFQDLDALVALDDIARTSEQRRERIRQGLTDRAISVACADRTPKGYAMTNDSFFGHAFIELVYVHADHRRRGIGLALMRHILDNANGSKLFTSTNRSNTAMQALLARLGFEASGIIDNLDPGDPELVFVKRLDRPGHSTPPTRTIQP